MTNKSIDIWRKYGDLLSKVYVQSETLGVKLVVNDRSLYPYSELCIGNIINKLRGVSIEVQSYR